MLTSHEILKKSNKKGADIDIVNWALSDAQFDDWTITPEGTRFLRAIGDYTQADRNDRLRVSKVRENVATYLSKKRGLSSDEFLTQYLELTSNLETIEYGLGSYTKEMKAKYDSWGERYREALKQSNVAALTDLLASDDLTPSDFIHAIEAAEENERQVSSIQEHLSTHYADDSLGVKGGLVIGHPAMQRKIVEGELSSQWANYLARMSVPLDVALALLRSPFLDAKSLASMYVHQVSSFEFDGRGNVVSRLNGFLEVLSQHRAFDVDVMEKFFKGATSVPQEEPEDSVTYESHSLSGKIEPQVPGDKEVEGEFTRRVRHYLHDA